LLRSLRTRSTATAISRPRPCSAALRLPRAHEALNRGDDVARIGRDRRDLAGRGAGREPLDRTGQRIDRGLDRAGLVREVALGRVDQRVGVGLDLLKLGLQPAQPTAGVQAGQALDRVLEVGAIRAVRGLAAAAPRDRDYRNGGDQSRRPPSPNPAPISGGSLLTPRACRHCPGANIPAAEVAASPQAGEHPLTRSGRCPPSARAPT
jgi:hypothetical protein